MNAAEALVLAEEIRQKNGDWSDVLLAIWLECNCHCVYCGRYMLESYDTSCCSEIDHLLPKARYQELECESSNQVLSCVPCHHLKGDWDPNTAGGLAYIASNGKPPAENERLKLIQRTRQHIADRRKEEIDKFSNGICRLILESALWVLAGPSGQDCLRERHVSMADIPIQVQPTDQSSQTTRRCDPGRSSQRAAGLRELGGSECRQALWYH